jgi:diguanylate cyclase (GGDEF)-like protein
MPRSRTTALAGGVTALIVAVLVWLVVYAARTLEPITPGSGSGTVPWVPALVAWVLAGAVTAGTLTWIVIALRSGSTTATLTAGGMAALAGAAVMLLVGSGQPALPVLGAAGFLLAASVADRLDVPAIGGARRIGIVIGALVVAELFVAAAVLVGMGDTLLLVAAGLALAAGIVTLDRPSAPEAFALAAGAGALGFARIDGAEAMIGVAALATSALLAARRGLDLLGPASSAQDDGDRLPDLAARLADAVLRFDGRLRLADWNATAATLLDLDETSRGTRLEDLLGIPLAGLPSDDRIHTVERSVGGLDVTIHRSEGGLVAIIRDPGRAPEGDRLGRELRGTIDELAQARRTIELQRAELERTASVDPLTGLPSRTAILDRLRIELAEAARYRHPIAVVLLDIDDFAEINRLHGTQAGDDVLAEVALRMRLRVRAADALGRLGSDQFLAILPHTDEAGAATFADALRRRLAAREVAVGAGQLRITVCAGVAVMHAGEEPGSDALLGRAEAALERAKRGGGDRIALAGSHPVTRIEEHRPEGDRTAADAGDDGGT